MGCVVALAGQVGGAKLADGLYRLRREALSVIVNTADDYEHLGLAFSPDIDTMLYTLAGIDDHGERVATQAIEAVGELRAADLSCECDNATH